MSPKNVEHPAYLVLRDVMMHKNSGELRVSSENTERRLFFLKGKVAFAMTNARQERLGEILFKIGKINQQQFWEIHKLLENQNDKMGKTLIKHEIISQKDLFLALLIQIRTITLSVFSMTKGEWNFIQGTPAIPEDSVFSVDIPGLIVDGVNQTQNLFYFQNKFLYSLPLLMPINDDLRDSLKPDDLDFYNFLSRFPEKDFQFVLRQSNLSAELFWQKTATLFLLNLLIFKENGVHEETSKSIEELMSLFDKLKARNLDHYEILGVDRQADKKEIKDAYFLLAKKYHPDRIGRAPDPDLKEKADFVFSNINNAYETLSDENRRRTYDSLGSKKNETHSKMQENLQEKARILFRKAKTLYNQQKYWEAAAFLADAVKSDPSKSEYFFLLGLAQSQVPSLRRSAEQNLQTVVQMEPWHADALVSLGLLFMKEKLPKRAEAFFRKALSANPDHIMARRHLEEIIGSEKKGSWFSILRKK